MLGVFEVPTKSERPHWAPRSLSTSIIQLKRQKGCFLSHPFGAWNHFLEVCSEHFRSVAQTVKHPPAMRETWDWYLGWEDPLEKEMAIHSSTLAWKILWMEEPGKLQSMWSQRVGHDRATSSSLSFTFHFHSFISWTVIDSLFTQQDS